MDASSRQWIAQLGVVKSLDEYNVPASSESFSSCTNDDIFAADHKRPTKMIKTTSNGASWGSNSSNNNDYNFSLSSSTCHLLSFSNPNDSPNSSNQVIQYSEGLMLKPKVEHVSADYEVLKQNHKSNYKFNNRPSASNLPSQEHVIAERRRRHKLNQRLIALSALIPGLNKMDKASVLGEATRYLKHLQEQVRMLEEKLAKNQRTVSSVVLKKSCLSMDDEDEDEEEDANSSSENNSDDPEIQVKVMDKEVLLIIHCEKQQGLVCKISNEMENLHFSVTNINSMPFGNFDVIITLTAQMEEERSITPRELARKLRTLFYK